MTAKLTLKNNSITLRLCNCMLIKFFSLIFLLFAFFIETGCQRNISPQALKAIDFFDNQQYSLAVIEFRKLLDRYPKDILYQYYLGASLVEINSSPSEANEYLKTATIKNTINKAWYYLGKNYYRQFKFKEAETAFNAFNKNVSWLENRNMETAIELERLKFAPDFFSNAIQLLIFDKIVTTKDSIFLVINSFSKSNNCICGTSENDFTLCKNRMKVGQYFYFSKQTNSRTQDKDIFRIQKLTDSSWSDPQNLGNIINSTSDEDYPYFDYNSGTLFFASKGHESVGGFDIFKSEYDSIKREWEKPQRLPFPINSPWDDFYWIDDGKSAYLISNRENNLGKVTIYHVEKPLPSKLVSISAGDEMLQLCMFKTQKKPLNLTLSPSGLAASKKDTVFFINDTLLHVLSMALESQRKCDSAIIDSKKCKLLLDNINDKEKRAILFTRIKQDEKFSAKIQSSINQFYAKANTILRNNSTYQKVNKDSLNSEKFNFSITDTSFYSKLNPIPSETKMPAGIVYRIQLGVFSKPVDYKLFGGIQPVSAEFSQDKKIIKYYAGLFKRFIEADNSLNKVKEYGFKEAFVIAYYNNKKIPVERAKEFERNQ